MVWGLGFRVQDLTSRGTGEGMPPDTDVQGVSGLP